jgi:hypothetical protein
MEANIAGFLIPKTHCRDYQRHDKMLISKDVPLDWAEQEALFLG